VPVAQDRLSAEIAGVSALAEPVRRALYLYVCGEEGEVSRDQAAAAVGSSRSMAGFHLDRLVEEGLLAASFRRLTGRTGPGAGRPAKLYRRSQRQLALSLPPRSYELAARILASAVDASPSAKLRATLTESARELGERIGADAAAQAGSAPDRGEALATLDDALAATGFEPEREAGEVRFRNCPFHALTEEHRELICGMNLALVEGMVAGVGLASAKPRLDPQPGRCCVCIDLPRKRERRGKASRAKPRVGPRVQTAASPKRTR
jgi:predicted ArsR family transcriptional regulator